MPLALSPVQVRAADRVASGKGMRSAMSRSLIAFLLTGASTLASADAVTDDWPFADAQMEPRTMSAFITAYRNWKSVQERKFRMGAFSQGQEHAIIIYVERGECAVLDGFLFGVGWHHIPNHEQYLDEDVLEYGRTIDALVTICQTIKQDRFANSSRR
jgi:hypothetical protein